MKKIILIVLISIPSFVQTNEQYIFNFTNPQALNYVCRLSAAYYMNTDQIYYNIADEQNGDDINVAYFAGSFSKTLEHNATTGILTSAGQDNYRLLLTALSNPTQANFNAISRDAQAIRKFVNPQGAYARSLIACPCAILPMPSAPTLASAQTAADMIEVYLKMICRDVAFEDYGTGLNTDEDTTGLPGHSTSITNNAAAILTALGSAYKGPTDNGSVTAGVLFRGTAAGCLVGPYISQFWYLPLHRIGQTIETQQYIPTAQAREFGVAWHDFVAIQNGEVPVNYDDQYDFNGYEYIINGRDAGTTVHYDGPGEFFTQAANILLTNGAPLADNFPYEDGAITNSDGFVTMNAPDLYTAILTGFEEGLKNAWAHKWLGNRRLRPEAMAGLVHQAKINNNNPYNLYSTIFATVAGIDLLAWVKNHNEQQASLMHNAIPLAQAQTYLLGLMYPEGSPVHPSYPAGHAVMAGACSTIMKAFFDDEAFLYQYVTPVKPDPTDATALINLPNNEGAQQLTVGGELDKLASNIALSRNFAGVHYRSDGDEGILLGEKVALKVLQDWARVYHESGFTGFELTLRSGQRVRVTGQGVINI